VATVHLPSDFASATGGLDQVVIEAPRVHELMLALAEKFPDIAPRLAAMAVAIDGDIYNDAEFMAVGDASQIHFVPRIAGG